MGSILGAGALSLEASEGSVLHDSDPDEDLLVRIARGDAAAVQAMTARKLPRLLSLADRMLGDRGEAEDVAQEAFLRIWKHARAWRSGKARFDTWLHRVALNLCYDTLRKRREIPTQTPPDQTDPAPSAEQALQSDQRSRRVVRALQALPERQREALVLQYYQGLSNIEAAGLMGVSVDALESLLSRARRTLKIELAGVNDDQ
jgi:RNA polymerase sigma-70 factor, ECF subfamily